MIDYERQAITSTARLPRHPSHRATSAQCGKCGKTIGVVDGGVVFVRHDGREVVATLPAEVRCERCGHRTMLMGRAA